MDDQKVNQTEVGEAEVQTKFSVGAVLKEAREQQGLSVADVANRIKFAPRQVEALEADDYSQLPEATFVRGFLRSYARLLEIDAAPLLAALPQSHAHSQSRAAAPVENKSVEVPFPSVLAARRSSMMWYGGAAALVIVLFIFSRVHDSATPAPAQPVAQGNVVIQELALPTASAPLAEPTVKAEQAPSVPSPQPAAVVAAAPAQPQVAAPVQAPAQPAATPKPTVAAMADKTQAKKPVGEKPTVDAAAKPAKSVKSVKSAAQSRTELVGPQLPPAKPAVAATAAPAPAAKPAAENQIALRMSFDEDSWVDVKDGTGRLMLSKLNTAGSLVRMSGAAPITISIGHAKGVHVFYKGREIPLAPHTKGEKAQLVVEKQ